MIWDFFHSVYFFFIFYEKTPFKFAYFLYERGRKRKIEQKIIIPLDTSASSTLSYTGSSNSRILKYRSLNAIADLGELIKKRVTRRGAQVAVEKCEGVKVIILTETF